LSTNPVSFVDLPAQYADMTEDIVTFVRDTMAKSAFVGGRALEKFETDLADYVGVKYAVGCSDGTMSLTLALLGAGLQKGEKVVVPANSYIASANAVVHAGGTPVVVDCTSDTYLIDLDQTESALKGSDVRFIMPVHLYGNPCPMDEIVHLASKYDAIVIEDNAQAIGAAYNGKKTGGFAHAAGVSFYPAKNLGAFGQGGAVLTNDIRIADIVRMYREQGQGSSKYYHDVVGYNGRLHSLQAGVLNLLLKKLDDFNSSRSNIAQWYSNKLAADRLQKTTPGATHVYHLFEYRCDSEEHRSELSSRLKSADVGFGYHYPVPIHKQKAYPSYNTMNLPNAERLARTLISLPMHPGLSEEEIGYVCDIVADES
jgi:dTDP-4-amino-4,6-dideoxygalactose transaminase